MSDSDVVVGGVVGGLAGALLGGKVGYDRGHHDGYLAGHNIGYAQGYSQRERELQPIIARLKEQLEAEQRRIQVSIPQRIRKALP